MTRSRTGDLRSDAVAGVVLGVESVPDGLASGVLAGVDPVSGLYGYLFGMVGAAAFTSSTFMAVQATGAMSLVVADTDLASRPDPERALFTLAVLTGLVMVVAGLLRGGRLLRFVPTAVMTGFVSAVGVNIVLGQLSNLSGYASEAGNRLLRAADLLVHPGRADVASVAVGALTVLLIVGLERTRLRSLGLVVAVAAASILPAVLHLDVALVSDLADLPGTLPAPRLPVLGDLLSLVVPALSLAFVGLVQGAAVSSGLPNPDGRRSDASRDFVAQGAGNVLSGVFQGMPVGGSMSASALVHAAGARSRAAFFVAGLTMAVVILALSDVVGRVAMPALAALLVVVGIRTVKPAAFLSVVRTGPFQATVLAVTFVLTVVVPLQYAVVTGVGLAIVLHVADQSNRVSLRRVELRADGRYRETDPPATLEAGDVVVLQPYGSLFFASAPVLERQLPRVTDGSTGACVVIRFRGVDQLGLTLVDVLRRYGAELSARGGALKVVLGTERALRQLRGEGLVDELGAEHVYLGTEWIGDTTRRAYRDALREFRSDE
ncbi:SulP family inorganic anion transporter [Phycicoccus endophyticus]|uniref:SulP family inorganic anion transporter n=1 Tax=Phycicoccus endophyticus TaxID=1690220 RepID=A0A7G9R1Y7_9MICO|nr:SulP family inorganic anion transporter [Phycicoccus endophyticus]NHI19758.1 SulP family inorganic anion transporter [Phycicoccus endophyticus]QNN49612.1 SulP family inorganic anion transporter [Phycicoccus endophyticus]GGL33324.1 DNA repair protein HhH-GPD [Phycicoccus endophyticus]